MCAQVERLLPVSREPERGRVKARLPETVGLAQLVGEDPAFLAVKRKLPLVAQREATVLLTGETGTGKEACARALHYLSRRTGKPFLPVNCGAIPGSSSKTNYSGMRRGPLPAPGPPSPG